MNTASRSTDLARSGPLFAGLLAVALLAFWPSYLSRLPNAGSVYTHLHAISATLWVLLLIAQPTLIRLRRPALHRALGRLSFVLAPALVVCVLLLAHQHLQGKTGDALALQIYILYLQLSLAALFLLCYLLALATRRHMALHARFMVGTGLTLIDPVVIRLMFWVDHMPTWNYQWFTFGLTDLVLVLLIARERRHAGAGRRVFPLLLGLFVLAQAPALFGLTETAPWQAFARWFAALPLA